MGIGDSDFRRSGVGNVSAIKSQAMPRSALLLAHLLFLCVATVHAQTVPTKVDVCELASDPKAFDGKTIEVRGALNVFFEDFTLAHPDCAKDQGIWLAFGGDVPGLVTSMVNDNFRKPGVDLRVKGISYSIKKDENFRRLYALLAARRGEEPEYRAIATLTGAFLSGEEDKLARGGGTYFRGYGHLGCCSLLIITQVSDVESTPAANLDLSGVVLAPEGRPAEGVTVYDDVDGGEPLQRQETVTGKSGEFKFSNSGQQLRVENPRYRPVEMNVEPGGRPIQVRLEDASRTDWILRECGESEQKGRIGFSVLFRLAPTVESSPFNEDGGQSFFVFPRGREMTSAELFIIRSAEKLSDSPGSRDSRWVKDGAGKVIGVDSRWMSNGYFGRRVSFLGFDNVHYSTKSGVHRRAYDQIIDSACVARTSTGAL